MTDLVGQLVQEPLDLVIFGGQLRPEGGLLVLHLLLHVGDLLVEGQVGVLQVLDLGDELLDPGPGLGQLVGGVVVGASLFAQLGLQVSHPLVVHLGKVLAALLHLLVVHGPQLLQGLVQPVLVLALSGIHTTYSLVHYVMLQLLK